MHNFVVVYRVYGIHYRYRCSCKTKAQAKKQCRENMFPDEIVEVYVED